MNCVIDNAIRLYARKGKTMEAIRDHIRNHYNISIDSASLKERLRKYQPAELKGLKTGSP